MVRSVNPENFCEFLKRQGHKIILTESCYWYNAQPGFFFYFPYHRLIDPGKEELNKLLWGEPAIGLRYFTDLNGFGKESYLIVCSDKDYSLESVDAKYARRQTRRGLENYNIQQIDFQQIIREGNPINQDTLIRQGRDKDIWNERKWQQYCGAAEGLDGFEVWGAFSNGKLAAFMIGFQMEDHFTILHHSSSSAELVNYVNNALVFTVTQNKLMSESVGHVSYGPESLDAPLSLDKFKFRMGYIKKPIKQRIVFNPVFSPLVNPISYRFIQFLSRQISESDTMRKLEGIFRFYLESN